MKFFEIKQYVLRKHIDFFGLCETWTNINSPFHLMQIDGYDMFSNPRSGRGGGTQIWVRKSMMPNLTNYSIASTNSEYEQLVVNVEKYIIIIFYNPPGCNLTALCANWEAILENKCTSNRIPVFMGDINADITVSPLKDFFESKSLQNLQQSNSRNDRLLDVCITYSFHMLHIESDVFHDIGNSDHLPIFVSLPSSHASNRIRDPSSYIAVRDLSNFNFESWNTCISRIDWTSFNTALDSSDVDSAASWLRIAR